MGGEGEREREREQIPKDIVNSYLYQIFKNKKVKYSIISLLHHVEIWELAGCALPVLQLSLSPPVLPIVSSGPQTDQGHYYHRCQCHILGAI